MKNLFAWAERVNEIGWLRSMRELVRDLRLLLAHRAEAVRIVQALGQLRSAPNDSKLRAQYRAAKGPRPELAPYQVRKRLNGYHQSLAREAAKTLLEPLRQIAERGAFVGAFGTEDLLIEYGRRAVAARCLPPLQRPRHERTTN